MGKGEKTVGVTHDPQALPQAWLLIEVLREALYDTVVQLTDARMRLRSIERLADKQ